MVPRGRRAPRCGAPCVWRSVSPWWRLRHTSPAGMEITGGCSRISRLSSHPVLTAVTRLLCLYCAHVHCCTRMSLMSLNTIYQSLYANILHYAPLCSGLVALFAAQCPAPDCLSCAVTPPDHRGSHLCTTSHQNRHHRCGDLWADGRKVDKRGLNNNTPR